MLVDFVERNTTGAGDRTCDRRNAGEPQRQILQSRRQLVRGERSELSLRRLLRKSDRRRRQREDLAQIIRKRVLAARVLQSPGCVVPGHVRQKVDRQHRLARFFDGIAQTRRQRIDRAAFQTVARNDDFAPYRLAAERQGDALQRHPLETAAKELATIRPEIRNWPVAGRDTTTPLRAQNLHPAAVRTEPWPACAAERQHRRIRSRQASRRPRVSNTSAPSSSHPVQRCRGAIVTPECVQPPQPGAQQGRGLHGFRKHPSARYR